MKVAGLVLEAPSPCWGQTARRHLASILVLVVAWAWCGSARADSVEHARAVRLTFTAPAGCPGEAAFRADLQRRSALIEFAGTDDTPAASFVVRIERAPSGYVGTLLAGADGGARRDVHDSDCATVASVLSLVVALAVDPRARVDRQPLPAESPPPPAAQVDDEPRAELSDPPVASTITPRGSERSLTASAIVRGGLWDGAALGPHLTFGWARPADAGVAFAPSLWLGVAAASGPDLVVADARASFAWVGAEVELCVVRMSHERLELHAPCLGANAGVVRGVGRDVPNAATESRAAVQGELASRLRVRLVGAWSLEVRGGLVVPVVRSRFVLRDPDIVVSETPAVAGFAGLGLGWRF